jgi:ubiquitin-activating enzyme E1
MCTLRNFPHLTDHCIEWARDQFELLFVKLAANCSTYLASCTGSNNDGDALLFEQKLREKAAVEPGAAFFDIRFVLI